MKLSHLLLSAVFAFVALSLGAVGERFLVGTAQAREVSKAAAQSLVGSLTHGQGTVEKTFSGPGGLTGVVVGINGHRSLAYVTPDGHYLVAGAILDAQGQNVLQKDAVRYGVIPASEKPAELARAVAKSDSFVVGKSGPEMVVFIDPDCIFCHKFYEEAKPLTDAGKLRVRFVVAAFLKPTSFPRAEAILGAADPAAALAENEAHFNDATEEGGIAPAKNASPEVARAVHGNTRLLQKSGEVATPTVIYCSAAGKVTVEHGVPGGGKSLSAFAGTIQSLGTNGTCSR